jgi:hypothetical protein
MFAENKEQEQEQAQEAKKRQHFCLRIAVLFFIGEATRAQQRRMHVNS